MSACPRDGWVHLAYMSDRVGLAYVLTERESGRKVWQHPAGEPMRIEPASQLTRIPPTLSPLEIDAGDDLIVLVLFAAEPLAEERDGE